MNFLPNYKNRIIRNCNTPDAQCNFEELSENLSVIFTNKNFMANSDMLSHFCTMIEFSCVITLRQIKM